MEISVKLPLDSDGFLRRECPRCEQQFKWHHGPANREAEEQAPSNVYYCPLCGLPAGLDEWWTHEQLDYSIGFAEPAVIRYAIDELTSVFKRNKNFKFRSGSVDLPEVPASLVEPDDMQIVASPCHAYEPVKVPETLTGPIYCLLCGTAFAL